MIREIPNTCPCCGKTSLVDNIFGDKESKIICYDCKLALFLYKVFFFFTHKTPYLYCHI